MRDIPSFEDEIEFAVSGAGKPCKTWYKVVGKLDRPPIIALHGGPAGGHGILLTLTDVYERHGIPIVFYDQIGCGRSTLFQERTGDTSFWTLDLFIAELENLIDHLKLRETGYYILGHSWGGMLGAMYASRQPRGLRKLVIYSSPASAPLLQEACNYLLSQLPADTRETLLECDRKGDFGSEGFVKASTVFLGRHFCRISPFPEELVVGFKHIMTENSAAPLTMKGPSEFTITGSFKDFEPWKHAHKIEVETLLLNGRYDEAMDSCMLPWFKAIQKVKWVTFEESSHMAHWEERSRFNEICGAFLVEDRT
ncbi:proline-specific peptidase [Xylariaceae sp. FL0016]|nr:proline-specific peptidase [Xylariaceae sp. FL0016]